jgi:hypothetical protein
MKNNIINTNNTRLSRKHAKILADIFKSDRMIPEFYDSLFQKFETNERTILDIKREFESECEKIIDRQILTKNDKISIVNTIFSRTLEQTPSKGIKRINRVYELSDANIYSLLDNKFSDYDSFIVIGCPESTDIDIVCFVRKQDVKLGTINNLSYIAENRLMTELTALGYGEIYSLPKDIDINLVYVDPETKMIRASLKGGKETQNIINATWNYHRQAMDDDVPHNTPISLVLHPMCNIVLSKHDMYDKIRAFTKYLLDFAEDICVDNIENLKDIRSDFFSSKERDLVKFVRDPELQIYKYIIYEPDIVVSREMNFTKWQDRFKSIIMKMIQISLIWRYNKSVYVKMDLAESVKNIFCGIDDESIINTYIKGAQWYLFRGTKGIFCKELFPLLFNEYIYIVKEYCDQ